MHFPDPDPPTISIMYEWSEICDQCGLYSSIISSVTSLKLITIFNYVFSDYLLFFGF